MLCEWTSKVLGLALTPNNIKAGFGGHGFDLWTEQPPKGIWDQRPGFGRVPTRQKGFATRQRGLTSKIGQMATKTREMNIEGGGRRCGSDDLSADPTGEVDPEPFYYVNLPDAEESTHEVQDRAVNIDPGFESSLREQHEDTNFNSFLALPEVIPARKKKPQQPTLDFTSSKILTSEEYIFACEEV